jgi:rod shape-determining protein MreB
VKRAREHDLAIDVGTAATRLYTEPRLTPLARPSVVWRADGPHAALRGGVVVDGEVATAILAELLRAVPRPTWRKPRALACVPTDASPAERAALVEAVLRAGAGAVSIAPEPLAAAVGAGIDVSAPHAQLVIDVGEGVTDCAIVRDGAVVASDAVRIGIADLRAGVREALDERTAVRVSPIEAERVLREIGVDPGPGLPARIHFVGSPRSGIGPVVTSIDPRELHAALDPIADDIVVRVGRFVASLPDALAGEIRAAGACLSGGGALVTGVLERLVAELAFAVRRAPDPLRSVIDGARILARRPLH